MVVTGRFESDPRAATFCCTCNKRLQPLTKCRNSNGRLEGDPTLGQPFERFEVPARGFDDMTEEDEAGDGVVLGIVPAFSGTVGVQIRRERERVADGAERIIS